MESPGYIDCCVIIGGVYELSASRRRATVADVIRDMDLCGIAGGMARHALAREYSPTHGNAALIGATAENDRLRPIAALAPLMLSGSSGEDRGGIDDPAVVRRYLSEHRFCGVTLYPSAADHNFSVAEWCSGPMLAAVEAMNMPLFLDFNDVGADTLAYLLMAHPSVPVIVSGIYYAADRTLFPLVDRHPNLYVVSTIDRQYRGITEFVGRFGAGRLVFGSNYPHSSMGSSVASIEMSDLPRDDLRRIASGNIESLLKEIVYDG